MSYGIPHPYLPLAPHAVPLYPKPHTNAPMDAIIGTFLLLPPVTPPSSRCIAIFLHHPLSRVPPQPFSAASQFCEGCTDPAPAWAWGTPGLFSCLPPALQGSQLGSKLSGYAHSTLFQGQPELVAFQQCRVQEKCTLLWNSLLLGTVISNCVN